MTQQEFYQRTGVEVSNKEFLSIHEVYCYSDLDKDEFCKMWCKMNYSRVIKANKDNKEAQRKAEANDILFKWFTKWQNNKKFQENYYINIAYIKLTTKEVKAISYVGIRFGNAENLSDLHYKVGKYLNIYK